MPLELTLAIGRAALQQTAQPQILKAPDEMHASKQPGKRKDFDAHDQQESVPPESSTMSRMLESLTAGTGGPTESVASLPAVEKQDSVDVQKETLDNAEMIQKPVATTKPAAARSSRRKRKPRTVDKDKKIVDETTPRERKRPPEDVKLSSSQRRKQRKGMPVLPGGVFVTTNVAHMPPSPHYQQMSSEPTLATGHAALQQEEPTLDHSLRVAQYEMLEPPTLQSLFDEPKESVPPESSTVARLPEPKEAVASESIVEKHNSLDVPEDTKESPERKQRQKPGAARARRTRKAKTAVTTQSPAAAVILSSSQRRKQRKDMPELPGGVFVTVTPQPPVPKRRTNQKWK